MGNDIDDYNYNLVALSSPTPERPFEEPNDFGFVLPSPGFFDFASYDSYLTGRPSATNSPAKPFFQQPQIQDIPNLTDLPPMPILTPKQHKKVQNITIQPFLSFDATENSVKLLRQHVSQK